MISDPTFDRLEEILVDHVGKMIELKTQQKRIGKMLNDIEVISDGVDFGYIDKTTGEYISRRK